MARRNVLGHWAVSCEDNILTLVHELFTATFSAKIGLFFGVSAKKAPRERGAFGVAQARALHIVVEEEFIRMWPQAQGIVLLALGRNPHVQKVLREHVA